MRAAAVISLLAAAQAGSAARADYACVFPPSCQTGSDCGTRAVMLIDLRLGDEGWRLSEAAQGIDLAARIHPDAGTYFANVFLTVEGGEHGMEAGQLSIARGGEALFTVHSLGYRNESRTRIGHCRTTGSGAVSE